MNTSNKFSALAGLEIEPSDLGEVEQASTVKSIPGLISSTVLQQCNKEGLSCANFQVKNIGPVTVWAALCPLRVELIRLSQI